jgi:predicted dehydrogenase
MIGLGIVGCGWAASEIVRAGAGLDGLAIVSVFDTDRRRAQALAAAAGTTVAADLDALLDHPQVDAVYAGLPHALLPEVVERALARGRHVLSEKPLAVTPDIALRLGEMADRRNLKLAVFFELRRAGTVEAARRIVQERRIGEARLVRLRTLIDKRRDYWGPPGQLNWRASRALAGGGVTMMNSIHQLDTLRYITGLDYVSVTGAISTLAAPAGVEVEDAASATIGLSNGGIVSLVASAHTPGATRAETIEIDGTLGRLDLPDPFGSEPLRLYADGGWTNIPVERPDSHRLMLQAFVDAVATGGAVPASAADAAQALFVVDGLYRSFETGRLVHSGASASKVAR